MSVTGVAVVTGAGSGLGREITRALLGAGWRVAAAGRREEALREAVSAPGLPAPAPLDRSAGRHRRHRCGFRCGAF